MIVGEVLSGTVGLITGLITGFIFERRATRAAKHQEDELYRQLSVLKTSVYSLGGKPSEPPASAVPADLAGAVTARTLATQDPDGRVDRRALIAYFLRRGEEVRDVEAAISSLCAAGAAREDGSWLQMV